MKLRYSHILAAGLCLLLTSTTLYAQPVSQTDVPKTFSYQGLLTATDGSPLPDGLHTITVTLYGDQAGTQVIWRDSYEAQTTGGLFNLYLGSGEQALPQGQQLNRPLWVGTSVDGGAEMGPLTPLSSSPYALNVSDGAITGEKLAAGAVTADKVDMDYVSGISIDGKPVTAKGTVLELRSSDGISLDYSDETQTLTIGTATSQKRASEGKGPQTLSTPDAWNSQGDLTDGSAQVTTVSGDWIGTTGNVNNGEYDFTIKVHDEQIMKYQHRTDANTPNIVGGHSSNSVGTASIGNVIAGGGNAGDANTIYGASSYGVIGGGRANFIGYSSPGSGPVQAVVGGGEDNSVGTSHSVIGGGQDNSIDENTAAWVTISGGQGNNISSTTGGGISWTTIGGGDRNGINGDDVTYSTIAGGSQNSISGTLSTYSAVGGGQLNAITESASVIAGGSSNSISSRWSTIGGGYDNEVTAYYGTVSGGQLNSVGTEGSSIGGGNANIISSGTYSTIAGGTGNTSSGANASIGGGSTNTIVYGSNSTISGGSENSIGGYYSTIGGGGENVVHGSNNTTIAGGLLNEIAALANSSTIGGGYDNEITADGIIAVIPGGQGLTATSFVQTVLGVENIPKGTINPGFTVAHTDQYNVPIFMIGNGNGLKKSNAFEISYNGHTLVYDINGSGGWTNPPGRAAIQGATYTDNIIYGWAEVDANANSQNSCGDFGIQNISHPSPGVYRVKLKIVDPDGAPAILDCGAAVATLGVDQGPSNFIPFALQCAQITTSRIVNNEFAVYITQRNPGIEGHCDVPIDLPFKFHVTGHIPAE